MSPPTEQLIRDYLNRLSVAARSRLDAADRRVLLERTRALIELQAGPAGTASPAHVQRVVDWLGDPAALVDLEYQRITAERARPASRESPTARRRARPRPVRDGQVAQGAPAGGGAPPRPAGAATRENRSASAPVTGRDPASGPGATRPAPEDHGPGGTAGLAAANAPGPAGEALPGLRPDDPQAAAEPAGEVRGAEHAGGAGGVRGAEPAGGDRTGAAGEGAALPPPAATMPGAVTTGGQDDATGRVPGRRAAAAGMASAGAAHLASRALGLARSSPLEAAALVVTGLGTAIFPPVWLVGAALAVMSKQWDFRDKWTGLAIPVLLVVLGTTAALILGGARPGIAGYAAEAWLAAGRLSRAGGLLGAVYLGWRLRRGRRLPKLPPWLPPGDRPRGPAA